MVDSWREVKKTGTVAGLHSTEHKFYTDVTFAKRLSVRRLKI